MEKTPPSTRPDGEILNRSTPPCPPPLTEAQAAPGVTVDRKEDGNGQDIQDKSAKKDMGKEYQES